MSWTLLQKIDHIEFEFQKGYQHVLSIPDKKGIIENPQLMLFNFVIILGIWQNSKLLECGCSDCSRKIYINTTNNWTLWKNILIKKKKMDGCNFYWWVNIIFLSQMEETDYEKK
mgnify:CR=1 FL=1